MYVITEMIKPYILKKWNVQESINHSLLSIKDCRSCLLQGSVSRKSLQIDMQNFVGTNLIYYRQKRKKERKVIFTKKWDTGFYHPSDDMLTGEGHPKPKCNTFCAFFQNYNNFFWKINKQPEANCLRNSKSGIIVVRNGFPGGGCECQWEAIVVVLPFKVSPVLCTCETASNHKPKCTNLPDWGKRLRKQPKPPVLLEQDGKWTMGWCSTCIVGKPRWSHEDDLLLLLHNNSWRTV